MKEEAMSNQIKSIMVVALLVVSFAIGEGILLERQQFQLHRC